MNENSLSRPVQSQRMQRPRLILARARRRCLDPSGRRSRLLIEQEQRDIRAMPRYHPEIFTRRLSRRDERLLRRLAKTTWPNNEYELEL